MVIAVDEINVGVPGRPEQDCGAGSVAGDGMGRGIVLAEISLDLDNAARQAQRSAVTHQHLAEKFASHAPWTPAKECAVQRANRPNGAGILPAVLAACSGLAEGGARFRRGGGGRPPDRRRHGRATPHLWPILSGKPAPPRRGLPPSPWERYAGF